MTLEQTTYERETQSVAETFSLGKTIGSSLSEALVVGLVGHLGAGKTQLVKGIAVGNGLDDAGQVTSPTFTLVQEYPGQLALYHVDVYRLKSDEDFLALGFYEWIDSGSAVIIEWADKAKNILPEQCLWIEIEATGEHSRRLKFTANGTAAEKTIEAIKNL